MKFRVTGVPRLLKPEARAMLREELMLTRDQVGSVYRGAVVKAIDATKPHAPVDEGVMRSGIQWDPTEGKLAGSVVPSPATEPYTVVQELGRRPGRPGPPLKPILEWVRRRGLAGTYSVKTGRRTGAKATREAEDLAAAHAIRRKLHRAGMKGRFFFRRGRRDPQARAKTIQLIKAAVRRFKSRLAGGGAK